MTVSQYYDAHVIDGRAPLGRSTPFEPPSWISRACYRGRVSFWLCKRDAIEIEQLDPACEVATLRTQPTRRPQAWHHAIRRKPEPFLLTA